MSALVASLLIATGLLSVVIGCAVAGGRLQAALRLYHRTASVAPIAPEEWRAWLLGGFSGMSVGLEGLSAVALWTIWAVAGLCLIGLGIRLL